MPLPEDYLRYPRRAYGADQDRYDWTPAPARAPVRLASGARAMAFIVVPLEFFPLNPPTEPFKHPGAMQTPYPDLRHYTTRDYGARVGAFRLLRELARAGLKATFAADAATVRRYPPLIEAVRAGGHELAALGVSSAHIHHGGMAEADERALVAETRAALPDAITWMSPARSQSFATPDLIAEAGFRICLDWESDQRPLAMRTRAGPLACPPLHNELSDFTLCVARGQSEDVWADQILEAAAFTLSEHEARGAQCLGFTLTPYVAGQPFRIAALRRMLAGLAAMDGLTIASAADVTFAFAEAEAASP